jgi:hypothetical protein
MRYLRFGLIALGLLATYRIYAMVSWHPEATIAMVIIVVVIVALGVRRTEKWTLDRSEITDKAKAFARSLYTPPPSYPRSH